MSKHILEIEVFEPQDKAQAKYIYRGTDDIYWTDDIDSLVESIRYDLKELA